MSDQSQERYQRQISNDCNLTNGDNNTDLPDQSRIQSSPLSNNRTRTLSTIVEVGEQDSSQQELLEGTNVIVNLVDCMKCYIRIPRCKIDNKQKNHRSNTNISIEIERHHEVEEFRGEQEQQQQEKASENQTLTQDDDETMEEEEEGSFGEGSEREDFHPMQISVEIYIPPPETLEWLEWYYGI